MTNHKIKNSDEIINFILDLSVLSDLDIKIIDVIGKKGSDTLTNIANELKVPRTTISYRIKLLENDSFIVRIPTTSKEKPLKLTENGINVFQDIILKFKYLGDKIETNNSVIESLGTTSVFNNVFGQIHDFENSSKHLRLFLKDKNRNLRWFATYAYGFALYYLPDKEEVLRELLKLTSDDENTVRWIVAYSLGFAFNTIQQKQKVWATLITLLKDEDREVQRITASALGSAFSQVIDKQQATKELLALTQDEDNDVRRGAASALGSAFAHVTDKQQATKNLLALTKDEDNDVRRGATSALGSAFAHVTDKQQATKDLLALTKDEDNVVRSGAASALGSAFPHVTDKKEALDALLILADEWKRDVRINTNYSLGRISIYKATLTDNEDGFRVELEKALEFFEKASSEATYYNPASFCLPFYRSFHAITSGKKDSEADVEKYLTEAKNAVGVSESKEKLLEAIVNLSNALIEVQKAKSFDEIKGELNAYSHYCNRASELLGETEGNAPGATMLLRKGLPIIDKKIKDTLLEIEEKAKEFCKESRQTPFEKISRSAYDNVKGLGEIDNPISVEIRLDRLIPIIRDMCDILPKESRRFVCGQLDEINDVGLRERMIIVESAFNCIRTQQKRLQEKLDEKK